MHTMQKMIGSEVRRDEGIMKSKFVWLIRLCLDPGGTPCALHCYTASLLYLFQDSIIKIQI